MDRAALAGFAAAIFVAAAIPGPAVVAIVARVLGRGPAGAAVLASGILLGSLAWLTLVAAGLALVAQVVVGSIFADYVVLAARSRRFFSDAGRASAVNRVGAAALAVAAR